MNQYYILLVEDNPDLRELFNLFLLQDGFEVSAVEDGEAALDALAKRKPDAVVTDLMMPNMDGLELIKWIRSQENMAGLPVIAMTAYGETMWSRAEKAGATKILPKPLDSTMGSQISNVLDQPQLTW